MKLLSQLRQRLESIGATLDEQAEQFVVCDSPSGYVWRANGNTGLTIHYKNNGGQSWLTQALRDEMPNLKMGLDKVTNEKELAERRWDLGDDSWGAAADAPARLFLPSLKNLPALKNLTAKQLPANENRISIPSL